MMHSSEPHNGFPLMRWGRVLLKPEVQRLHEGCSTMEMAAFVYVQKMDGPLATQAIDECLAALVRPSTADPIAVAPFQSDLSISGERQAPASLPPALSSASLSLSLISRLAPHCLGGSPVCVLHLRSQCLCFGASPRVHRPGKLRTPAQAGHV